jgi:hypothetical protein
VPVIFDGSCAIFFFTVNACWCVNYINLFVETITTQRFNEIIFVSSSSTLLHVSDFHETIIR